MQNAGVGLALFKPWRILTPSLAEDSAKVHHQYLARPGAGMSGTRVRLNSDA